MTLITIILIYLILGLLFTNMYTNIINYIVANDPHRINKRLLYVMTVIHMTLTFPVMIYKILKKDIQFSEDQIKKKTGKK